MDASDQTFARCIVILRCFMFFPRGWGRGGRGAGDPAAQREGVRTFEGVFDGRVTHLGRNCEKVKR